jgi:hypothetical protein
MFFYYLFLIFSIHLYVSPMQQIRKTILGELTHHAKKMLPPGGLSQQLQNNFSSENKTEEPRSNQEINNQSNKETPYTYKDFRIYLKQYMAEIEKSYAELFGDLLSSYVYPSEEMKNILNCERNNTQNLPINSSDSLKIKKEFCENIINHIKSHLNSFTFENENTDQKDLLEKLNLLEKKINNNDINGLEHILHFLKSPNTTNRVKNLYQAYTKKMQEQHDKKIQKAIKKQQEQQRKIFLQKVGGGVVAAIVIIGGVLYVVKGKNEKEVEKKIEEVTTNQKNFNHKSEQPVDQKNNQIKTKTTDALDIELNEEEIQQLKKTILEKIESNHIQNQENIQSTMTNFYLEKIRPHLNKDQLSLHDPHNDGLVLREMIQATDQFKNIAEQLTQQLDDKNKIEETQNNKTKELSQNSNEENQNKQSQDSNQETSKQQTQTQNKTEKTETTQQKNQLQTQQQTLSQKSSLPIPSKSILNTTTKKALAGAVGLTLLGLGIKKGYDYYKKKKQKRKTRHSQQNSSNKQNKIIEKNTIS